MAGSTFEATTENFQEQVIDSSIPVLVDFWAEWCQPCKAIAPIVEQIAFEKGDVLRVGKLDADQNYELVTQYGVRGIPTLILFKNGEDVHRITGFKPKDKILQELSEHVSLG
ncbi:MAG: thioredoxin [Anaerolineaceae bacterium]|nr:thioredoxin [Anaerolineaceae bacterium]MCY4106615.1 thioredoxin [Chloroflexota bacterium]